VQYEVLVPNLKKGNKHMFETEKNQDQASVSKKERILARIAQRGAALLPSPEKGRGPNKSRISMLNCRSTKVAIHGLFQVDLYADVPVRLTPKQLSYFLNNTVPVHIEKVKPNKDWPVHIVYPKGVPLDGPHTEYYPPVMSILILDDMDRKGVLVVFGNDFGNLDELQALVQDVSWTGMAVEYPDV
jgi:hypothetical protein